MPLWKGDGRGDRGDSASALEAEVISRDGEIARAGRVPRVEREVAGLEAGEVNVGRGLGRAVEGERCVGGESAVPA